MSRLNRDCKKESLKHLKETFNREKCRLMDILGTEDKAINYYTTVISPNMAAINFLKGGRYKTRRTLKYMIKDLDRQISRLEIEIKSYVTLGQEVIDGVEEAVNNPSSMKTVRGGDS